MKKDINTIMNEIDDASTSLTINSVTSWITKDMFDKRIKRAFPKDIGDISDGSHSFNELYYQRCMLFAALVNLVIEFKDCAWKTYRHEDGELCFGGGWFLVCIETPEGPYSYHYENKYWDLFKCKELEVAKPFDGHTEKDVTRLLSL